MVIEINLIYICLYFDVGIMVKCYWKKWNEYII